MKARIINAVVFAAIIGATDAEVLNVWAAQDCPASSLVMGVLGFTLIIGGLGLVLDNYIKERAEKRQRGNVYPREM